MHRPLVFADLAGPGLPACFPFAETLLSFDMNQLGPQDLLIGFISYFVFLFSTTCHEASHALAAKLGGDPTAALGGQVSLNPIPHIRRSPFGMIVVPLLGIFAGGGMVVGWANAPFDPLWERRYPRRSAWMALAGPAANFTLMLIAAATIHIARSLQLFSPDPYHRSVDVLALVLSTMFYLNLLLGTFNLLPVPPLDGSTAIMLFMDENRAQRYLDWIRGNSYAIAGLLVGLLVFYKIFPAIAAFAQQLLL
jgi:Zn-dependent protease